MVKKCIMALFLAENLVKAIESRDLLEVEKSLFGGANPNLLLPNGVTPFHLAGGPLMDITIIQALLNNNANPNITDSDGVTLTHIAAMWDKLDCLQLLYNSGADIFIKDKDGFDVLWYAKDNNSTRCIDYVKGIQNQLEYVRKTPKTPTFDCNVSFRRKKTPKSSKSTPRTLKDSTTSPLAFNQLQYNPRQTPKHCSACKKSFSPQLCSDCHTKTPTRNNHVKNLCNELKNIDISNSTQKSKPVLGIRDANLPDHNLSEVPDGIFQLKSPHDEAKQKKSLNSSFVFYQNVFKQNEMLSATKENDSPCDEQDEWLIKFDKSVNTETKPGFNTTTYDPEMQEFLKGCLPISHASYNCAGGLDVSSPDNCVTYAKSSSESGNSSNDSGHDLKTVDNTSVWVTCCKPNDGLDNEVKATVENNDENQTVENNVFENSESSIVATPNSSQSSIEYRKKLLFSTKPKKYFEKLEKKLDICEPIKTVPLPVHENQNISSSDSSSEFTLADSTVPVDITNDDDDIDICKDILEASEQGDPSHCHMVDNSVQFCNITKDLEAEESNQNVDASSVGDKKIPEAQNEPNNTCSANNDGVVSSEDSYVVVVDNSAQLSVNEGCLPTEGLEKSKCEDDEVNKQLEWSKISENTVCDVLTNDKGIALLERRKFAIDSPIKKRLSKSIEIFSSSLQLSSNPIRVSICEKDESTLIYDDWKELLNEDKSSPNSSANSQSDEDPIEKLTDKEIRQMLVRYGCHPGPIAAARAGYIKRLKSFLNNSNVPVVSNASPPIIRANVPVVGRYSAELEKVLNGRRLPDSVADDDLLLRKQFEVDDPNVKWREGKLKNNFNYILLDPRKLNGLSDRISNLSELQSFQDFLSAIFYVGKGRQARPYAHFYEALQKDATSQVKLNPKVKHIQEIWSCDLGVISLHIFQSVIACEAFTREAAMLDAIKLSNLTNRKRGDYYGKASTWSLEKKEQYGTFLLMKALKIYAVEGERQIKPANLKLKQQWPKNAHV